MTQEVIAVPNAPHRNPHYALRIPTETMDKLKYIADQNGRSANKEIEQLILKHIQQFQSVDFFIRLSQPRKNPQNSIISRVFY